VINAVRRALRRRIPAPIRLRVALSRRTLRDAISGHARAIVRTSEPRESGACAAAIIAVVQPIRQSEHWEGKLANLRLAAQRLDGTLVAPGRIFSFWTLVGAPDAENGFKVGRSIRADVVAADVGGGLCQLSGLAYELGLRAGIAIVERHPHTQDLYTDETRFTPLGLDATVVYGHKDLRLRNDRRQPLAFRFEVDVDQITGRVLSAIPFAAASIEIVKRDGTNLRDVRVYRTPDAGVRELMSADVYAATAPHQGTARSDR
jgi:vancomycin resistance protein VanW